MFGNFDRMSVDDDRREAMSGAERQRGPVVHEPKPKAALRSSIDEIRIGHERGQWSSASARRGIAGESPPPSLSARDRVTVTASLEHQWHAPARHSNSEMKEKWHAMGRAREDPPLSFGAANLAGDESAIGDLGGRRDGPTAKSDTARRTFFLL